jgi:uncharacterized protein YqgC (DUF456 family)
MPEFWQSVLPVLTLIVMLVGLFGLLVPMFPGIFVIWLAALGFGVLHGFGGPGIWLFVGITLLMLVGETIDNVLMGIGARKGGAACSSILFGFLAGVVGTLIFPPVGGLIAAPLTVLLLEYWRSRDWKKARSALGGLALGWGLSFVARLGIGVVMIGLWGIWAVK